MCRAWWDRRERRSRSTSTTRTRVSRTTWTCFDEQGGTSLKATELAPGVVQQTLELTLDEGTYFFQCDAHPTTMTGQLAVVKGAK